MYRREYSAHATCDRSSGSPCSPRGCPRPCWRILLLERRSRVGAGIRLTLDVDKLEHSGAFYDATNLVCVPLCLDMTVRTEGARRSGKRVLNCPAELAKERLRGRASKFRLLSRGGVSVVLGAAARGGELGGVG